MSMEDSNGLASTADLRSAELIISSVDFTPTEISMTWTSLADSWGLTSAMDLIWIVDSMDLRSAIEVRSLGTTDSVFWLTEVSRGLISGVDWMFMVVRGSLGLTSGVDLRSIEMVGSKGWNSLEKLRSTGDSVDWPSVKDFESIKDSIGLISVLELRSAALRISIGLISAESFLSIEDPIGVFSSVDFKSIELTDSSGLTSVEDAESIVGSIGLVSIVCWRSIDWISTVDFRSIDDSIDSISFDDFRSIEASIGLASDADSIPIGLPDSVETFRLIGDSIGLISIEDWMVSTSGADFNSFAVLDSMALAAIEDSSSVTDLRSIESAIGLISVDDLKSMEDSMVSTSIVDFESVELIVSKSFCSIIGFWSAKLEDSIGLTSAVDFRSTGTVDSMGFISIVDCMSIDSGVDFRSTGVVDSIGLPSAIDCCTSDSTLTASFTGDLSLLDWSLSTSSMSFVETISSIFSSFESTITDWIPATEGELAISTSFDSTSAISLSFWSFSVLSSSDLLSRLELVSVSTTSSTLGWSSTAGAATASSSACLTSVLDSSFSDTIAVLSSLFTSDLSSAFELVSVKEETLVSSTSDEESLTVSISIFLSETWTGSLISNGVLITSTFCSLRSSFLAVPDSVCLCSIWFVSASELSASLFSEWSWVDPVFSTLLNSSTVLVFEPSGEKIDSLWVSWTSGAIDSVSFVGKISDAVSFEETFVSTSCKCPSWIFSEIEVSFGSMSFDETFSSIDVSFESVDLGVSWTEIWLLSTVVLISSEPTSVSLIWFVFVSFKEKLFIEAISRSSSSLSSMSSCSFR